MDKLISNFSRTQTELFRTHSICKLTEHMKIQRLILRAPIRALLHKGSNKHYALFPVRRSANNWELRSVPIQAHLKANVKTGEPVSYLFFY